MNKIIYEDCMNETNGLPTLPDKSIDLCLTDPPYNLNNPIINAVKEKRKGKIHYYKDDNENYWSLMRDWFKEAKRVCNRIVFTPGYNNFKHWFLIDINLDFLIHYNRGKLGETRNCKLSIFEPILTWNVNKNTGKFIWSVFEEHGKYKKIKVIHPCPKNPLLWKWILLQLKPKSVLDPFIGSGTTAEMCTKLKIPYLGYEIKKEYEIDLKNRLRNCVYEKPQISLLKIIKNKEKEDKNGK